MKPNRFMLALAALCFAAGGASAQQTDGKSVAPKTYKAYMVSDAHLDTQWNWDVQTTIREYIPRTLFQNLYLMERFPDYRFSFEGRVVGRQRPQHAFGRVVLPQHPARTGVL